MDIASVSSYFTHIPTDLIIIVAFGVLIAIDALRSGTSRAIALALSAPLALLTLQYVSGAELMGGIWKQFSSPLAQAVFAAIVLVIFFILMYQIVDSFGGNDTGILQAIISAVAVCAVVIVVWMQVQPLDSLWHFGEPIRTLFGASYRFWWFIGAYLALAFARG